MRCPVDSIFTTVGLRPLRSTVAVERLPSLSREPFAVLVSFYELLAIRQIAD
jgi:hypothetical protein